MLFDVCARADAGRPGSDHQPGDCAHPDPFVRVGHLPTARQVQPTHQVPRHFWRALFAQRLASYTTAHKIPRTMLASYTPPPLPPVRAANACRTGWSSAASSLSLRSSLQALCSSLLKYVSQLTTWALFCTSALFICNLDAFSILLIALVILLTQPTQPKDVDVGKIRILTGNLVLNSRLTYETKEVDFLGTIVCNSQMSIDIVLSTM